MLDVAIAISLCLFFTFTFSEKPHGHQGHSHSELLLINQSIFFHQIICDCYIREYYKPGSIWIFEFDPGDLNDLKKMTFIFMPRNRLFPNDYLRYPSIVNSNQVP